ncbi:nuclear transport factor 2 family protein [Herbiconiux liangxiaofengii]|uniref:nuclear transport factor 2 family protein n=1 Tax=Herbiconiux liangxiaofengii TaxID=3342795 RepID=UPI0035BAC9FD
MSSDDWVAERLEIRDVIDRYAHHADRRQPKEQAAVFTADGTVLLYEGDPNATAPVQTVSGRDDLTSTFAGLIAQYDATTYLNGQSTIERTGPASATGETYCLAYHVLRENDQRMLLTMSIRYLDSFTKIDGSWLIAERKLIFDWTDRRPSHP